MVRVGVIGLGFMGATHIAAFNAARQVQYPCEIVAVCGISSPSLAGVLARMDAIGLVARQRIDHDQRRVMVSLTSRSRALAAKMAPRIESAYAEIEKRIGRDFTQRFYRTLDDLIEMLGEPPASDDD